MCRLGHRYIQRIKEGGTTRNVEENHRKSPGTSKADTVKTNQCVETTPWLVANDLFFFFKNILFSSAKNDD